MSEVHVNPMPKGIRAIPERWRPLPPPIFPNGDPSPEDIELARELFLALDPESQRWYSVMRTFRDLQPPPAAA